MAVESTFHKTHCGKPSNKAYCAQGAIRLHRVPKTREWGLIPLSTRGFRGSPPSFFFNFGRFYVRFNGVFMHLGPDFSPFGHDISSHARNRMLDKIVFRQSRFFFTFILQHVSLTLLYLCPRRFWIVFLALILGGPSKSCVFEKIYT